MKKRKMLLCLAVSFAVAFLAVSFSLSDFPRVPFTWFHVGLFISLAAGGACSFYQYLKAVGWIK
ncbi:MAG TPA: hypothetical protein P5089_00465 [Candidatus Portnoybacteria bacterium]|nr:hypothetical protein [Candidatus Portnoybacteria bacterium]